MHLPARNNYTTQRSKGQLWSQNIIRSCRNIRMTCTDGPLGLEKYLLYLCMYLIYMNLRSQAKCSKKLDFSMLRFHFFVILNDLMSIKFIF